MSTDSPHNLRIAIISTMSSAPWGGSEELWLAMGREALKQGHQVAVSVARWPSIHPKLIALRDRGALILRRPLPRRPRIDSLLARARPPFRSLFAFRPHVVCISQGGTHDATLLPAPLSPLSPLYSSGLPYVVICHSTTDTYLLTQAIREMSAHFFSRAYRVGFVSERGIQVACRQLATHIPNSVVLRNPINLTGETPLPWPAMSSVRMASMGHLQVAWKGQDTLLEALAAQPWRGRDWRLHVYGEGPDRQYLEALAAYYGISERVQFMGYVNDVRSVWSDHHLLVLPSRVEGVPLVLVEAMLCGRPSVVTDVGGNTEWVQEGQTGFVAEAPTSSSFGTALERAWAARAEWEAIGLRAHESALVRIDPHPGATLLSLVLEAARAAPGPKSEPNPPPDRQRSVVNR